MWFANDMKLVIDKTEIRSLCLLFAIPALLKSILNIRSDEWNEEN